MRNSHGFGVLLIRKISIIITIMCDTLSYSGRLNQTGVSYFAKNSDREPGEIQVVEYHPRIRRKGKMRVTHTEVEFDGDTNAMFISRPHWIWGAEMGFNEYGVVMGNEAIFTSGRYNRTGLLGMDLLRLALEIAVSASDAAHVVTGYLETYGQGGSNSSSRKLYYDNVIMISDFSDTYIIDLVGSEWRLRKVDGHASISNFSNGKRMNVTDETHSRRFRLRLDHLYTPLGKGEIRQRRTENALSRYGTYADLWSLMSLMRSHSSKDYHPSGGDNSDICMHSGHLTRINQTANSMITEYVGESIIGWFTFSSNPCISLYKPVFLDHHIGRLPQYSKEYWLRVEELHRKITAVRDRKVYRKCMEITESNQKVMNELVQGMRSKIFSGKNLEQEEVDSVISASMDLDSEHLRSLAETANIRTWSQDEAGEQPRKKAPRKLEINADGSD